MFLHRSFTLELYLYLIESKTFLEIILLNPTILVQIPLESNQFESNNLPKPSNGGVLAQW